MFKVFHRTWWKDAQSGGWPNGLEPEAGEKHPIGEAETEEEARAMCKEWNREHKPGRYSDKAEYERA